MNSKVWGPKGWFFIHSIALRYPNNPTINDKLAYYNFYKYIGDVLPCPICQEHYKTNFRRHDIKKYLTNYKKLFIWTVDMHNFVNQSTGKPVVSYNQAKYHIMDEYSNPFIDLSLTYVHWISLFILCVLLIIYRDKTI